MSFAPTLICKGYTAEGWLAVAGGPSRRVLLDEYSCAFERRIMAADGMMAFANSVNSIRRHGGAWLADVPKMNASVAFDTTAPLLMALAAMLRGARNSSIGLTIYDRAADVEWVFQTCYMTDIGFGGDENAVVKPSLGLYIPTNTFNYEWGKRTLIRTGMTGLGAGVGNERFVDMVPYWMWQIDIDNVRRNDISHFEFKFEQTITPKFECTGDANASQAKYLLFGLPTLSFSATEIHAAQGAWNLFPTGTQMRDSAALASHTIVLGTTDTGQLLKMTGAYETRLSPDLVAFGEYPTLTRSWNIAGQIQ